MSEELKPCSQCGGDAQTDFIEGETYIIECYQCGMRTGWEDSPEDAIAAWNRRTPAELEPGAVPIPISTDMARMMLALGHRYLKENAPEHLAQPAPASTGREDIGWKMANWLFGLSVSQLTPDSWRKTCADLSAAWHAASTVAARELDVEAERREFEAWARDNRYDLSACGENSRIGPADAYRNTATAHAWDVWRAARSAAQSTAPVSTEQAGDAWISVEDRLPAKYEEVMIWPHPSDYCMTAELFGHSASGRPIWKYGEYVTGFGHEVIEMTRAVTHWMNRPAAPSPNNSPVGAKEQDK